MICMYHRIDFDGKCAGAIVRYKYPGCELYGIDYGDKFDVERIKGQDIIIVDYTLEQPGEMKLLIENSKTLVWIDHHNTAITIEKELGAQNIPGFRLISTSKDDPTGKISSNRISGCELTWEYLFPEKDIPYSVYLLGRYDVWDQSNKGFWDKEILPFQYGMRLQHAEPDDINFWKLHFESFETDRCVNDTLITGEAALAYDENLSERIAKGLWFPIEFKGFKFQVINRSHANSHSAKSIWNPEEYDAVMYFSRGPNIWKISMFTDKPGIDLYPLAKSMGGGGHSQACGFTTTNIMETIPQLIEF